LIFVTVGAQMSFDRLVGWVDDWAVKEDRDDVVAQIGPSEYVPQRLRVVPFMTPPEFRARLESADVIVAHAGMGSIISALELAKPIVVVPRHGARKETRNDHQIATARRLEAERLVRVADSPEDLARHLAELDSGMGDNIRIAPTAQESLLGRLRDFAAAR